MIHKNTTDYKNKQQKIKLTLPDMLAGENIETVQISRTAPEDLENRKQNSLSLLVCHQCLYGHVVPS